MVETSPGSNVYFGSGNVFVDLGFPDAEERTAKMRLVVGILRIVEERRLSKKEAAKVLSVTQRKISALQLYKLDEFTVENLIQLASALEYEVVIELRPRAAVEEENHVLSVNPVKSRTFRKAS